MKKIIVFVAFAIFVSGPSFAKSREDRLDPIPSMSGKIEIMEALGLIEHENPFQQDRAKKSQNLKKGTLQKVRANHLADLNSAE